MFKPNRGSVRKEKKMLGKALYIFLELYIPTYYRLDGRAIVCIDQLVPKHHNIVGLIIQKFMSFFFFM